jgi:hypothetical protein
MYKYASDFKPSHQFFFAICRMARRNNKTRKNVRKNKRTRKNRRGGQRANASTCPPGQTGVNFKNWGGACGPYNSTYKLMSGTTN